LSSARRVEKTVLYGVPRWTPELTNVRQKGWIALARRTTADEESPEDYTNAWLSTHTLQDIRELAQELSDQGEDVSELVSAVNELEEVLEGANGEPAGVASEA